ncbi:MAG: GNAT family N-acetyltransferase [Acidobacteriaceae bacterium]|nr:GNAT family N-acetyltransferase [Acidobacteriaceae bacterium]MBV9498753.1 GNAT family N-acetyltransferase [Acidobacteriaceae bacterium]
MAARFEASLAELVELPKLGVTDLDPLLSEEIGTWRERFAWDFRPSADLLRRFLQIHSLYGYALTSGSQIIGYAYQVCEGRKGLIGDFYLLRDYASPSYEMLLLGAMVGNLTQTPGIRRIESQLMLLNMPITQPLPSGQHLRRHDRYFMDIPSDAVRKLVSHSPSVRVSYQPWADRYQEETAHVVAAAYRGHVDSDINDQYRTIPGARHFLTNIIKFPGCGNFFPGASVVALDETTGRVCGVCLASMVSQSAGHVTQLCILPAVRKARLGYELLRQTLLHLLEAGCSSISLTVTCSNVEAIRLYESIGFQTTATFPALVWEGF